MEDQPPSKLIRLESLRKQIQAQPPESVEFSHAVLTQVGLPRSRTEDRIWERRSGNAAVFLEAGHGPDAKGGIVPMPLPYGAHPRLLLLHMSTEAVRTKSKVVDVGQSIRAFFNRLDLPYNGLTVRNFKRQLMCLSAMHMTLTFSKEGRLLTTKCDPIESFDGWLSLDPNQKSLWNDTLELTDKFYETLLTHAVPLDPRAINALQGSALALDVYSWLAHRLCRVRTDSGVMLRWSVLKDQFGSEYTQLRNFKQEFKKSLAHAVAVYPQAKLEVVHGGIKLKPSPPPIPKTQVVVSWRETLPNLKPETLEQARKLAPGHDKYALESTWREWSKGKPKPKNVDKAFLGWVVSYTKAKKSD